MRYYRRERDRLREPPATTGETPVIHISDEEEEEYYDEEEVSQY